MAEPPANYDGISPGMHGPDRPPPRELHEDLIKRVVNEGRATLMVRSSHGGRHGHERGFQDVYEKNDPRRGEIAEILDSPSNRAYDAAFGSDPRPQLRARGVNEVLVVTDLAGWRGKRGGQDGPDIWYEAKKGPGGRDTPGVERPVAPRSGSQMAIYYRVEDNTEPDGGRNYPSGVGRVGNYLDLELIIPMDLGKEVTKAIGHRTSTDDPTPTGDPTLIRRIIETSIRQKYIEGFLEDWDHFSRPPWEKLDAIMATRGMKSRMYVADLIRRPQDYQKPYTDNIVEFNPQQKTTALDKTLPPHLSSPQEALEQRSPDEDQADLEDVRKRLNSLSAETGGHVKDAEQEVEPLLKDASSEQLIAALEAKGPISSELAERVRALLLQAEHEPVSQAPGVIATPATEVLQIDHETVPPTEILDSVDKYVRAITRSNVFGHLAPGAQYMVNGTSVNNIVFGGFKSNGPNTELDRLALKGEGVIPGKGNRTLADLGNAIYEAHGNLDRFKSSSLVGVYPSDRPGYSVLAIHFFQQSSEKVGELDGRTKNTLVPNYVQAELPAELMKELLADIQKDPDKLESFYERAFKGLDRPEGSSGEGFGRAKSDGFYLISEQDMTEGIDKAVLRRRGMDTRTRLGGIFRDHTRYYLESMPRFNYQHGPYGTGPAVNTMT